LTFRVVTKYDRHVKDAPPPNGIGHFDIVGPDSQALHRFYAAVFGWEVVEQGPGYALVGTPAGTPDGAVLEADEASVTIGVVVSDLDGALAEAEARGGQVVMPATDNGWVVKAQVADPAGNLVTLIRS
jgi:predicted enzyme related to lactoylglutathione lyase